MRKFKLITLLGIRPDYIRLFKLIQLLDNSKNDLEHLLVHSGQHYNEELFGIFLKELGIRYPDIDLGIGKTLRNYDKNNHASQLALLSERISELIEKEKPDAVMYLGDTNTVLSSVVVARSRVPVIHVEAGGRSFDWRMPEEKNRIIIDHLSDVLYAYLDRYKEILISEGIESFRIKVIGNIIYDAINNFISRADESKILQKLGLSEKNFMLFTLHREENASQDKNILANKILDVLKFAKEKDMPVVFPVMPRTKDAITRFNLNDVLDDSLFIQTKPLGFFEFLKLEKYARLIVSDSGTVQEEALILGVPCVVARRSTERPETIWAGATILEKHEGKNTLYNGMVEAFDMKVNWDRDVLNPDGGSPSEKVYYDLIARIEIDFFSKSRSFKVIKNNPFAKQAYDEK